MVQKIYFYRPHRKILLFRIFSLVLALIRGAPQSPLRVFKLLICQNSSQYTYEQPPKNRTAISSKLNFLEIYQYRRHICAGSALMGYISWFLRYRTVLFTKFYFVTCKKIKIIPEVAMTNSNTSDLPRDESQGMQHWLIWSTANSLIFVKKNKKENRFRSES
jgi:hypothetical protein